MSFNIGAFYWYHNLCINHAVMKMMNAFKCVMLKVKYSSVKCSKSSVNKDTHLETSKIVNVYVCTYIVLQELPLNIKGEDT